MDTIWGMHEGLAAIVIPTAASIIVFILGFIINELLETWKEKSRRVAARKNVLAWIDIVFDPLNKNISNIRQFAKDCINNRFLQQPAFKWIPLLGEKLERVID